MSFTAFTIATMSVIIVAVVVMTIKIMRLTDEVRALRARQNSDIAARLSNAMRGFETK